MDIESLLFRDWAGVGRVVVVGVLAYAGLVALLRTSGKRTLAKLNAFDLVVTVALGSTLATVLLNRQVPLAEGLAALALLIGLQFAVTWTSVRVPAFRRAVRAEPTVLLRRGEPLPRPMRRERITEDELLSAIRDSGGRSLSDAEAVFLESDGTLTALLKREAAARSS